MLAKTIRMATLALMVYSTGPFGRALAEPGDERARAEERERARRHGLHRDVEELEEAVKALEEQVGALDTRADVVDGRLADLDARANGLEARVTAVEAAVKPAAVTVDCNAGQTVGAALATPGTALTITILGRCNENVVIRREDVTLVAGAAGATINGPDATANTVRVLADRVTIDGLTITGGRNGVTAEGAGQLFIQNSTVGPAGVNGISVFHGAEGFVTNCTVQNNPVNGIEVQGAAAAIITTSTITGNGGTGIVITNGGHARIGVTALGVPAGNMITNSGSSGMSLTIGASAFIVANTISGNGRNPAATNGRAGITVIHAVADLGPGNIISGNAGNGLALTAAQVLIGDATFGTTPNAISVNGATVPGTGGIFLQLGSITEISNTVIDSNTGPGVSINARSTASVSAAIRNNGGNGILVTTGSAAFGAPTLTGNGAGAVKCVGDEASIALNGVAASDIDPACTGF